MDFWIITTWISIGFIFVARKKISLPMWVILAIAFFIRLFVVFYFSGRLSMDLYTILMPGVVLLQHKHIYPSLYFPFLIYLGATAILIGKYIAPFLFLKSVFSLFDVGIVYMVYRLRNDRVAALLYALNPVTLILASLHGQTDTIPLFFLLWSILILEQKKEVSSAILFTIAVITKDWPLLFSFVSIKWTRKKWVWVVLPMVIFLLVGMHSLLTHVSIRAIITPIKDYRGIYTIWGLGMIMQTLVPLYWGMWIQPVRRVFFLIFGAWMLIPRKRSVLSEYLFVMMGFFVISPLFGNQWLAWIVPFMIIVRPKGYMMWFFLVVLFEGFTFGNEGEPITKTLLLWNGVVVNCLGLLVWWWMVRMFFWFRKSSRYRFEIPG